MEDEMPLWNRRSLTFALTILSALPLAGCQTDKGVTWPAFGSYRLPYADGTDVHVNRDFTTHVPIGRYDLKGHGGGPYSVVAAADGWIRFIVDSNAGHTTGNNNYVWIEHPYPFCQAAGVTWPGKPADYAQTCIPCLNDRCNEWTKYSHMSTDSTTVDAGVAVGDWVAAGTFLGYEDDIGHASGDHLHWEVAKLDPDNPLSDYADGYTFDWSSGGWVGSPNVLPSICGVGILYDGDTHTAGPCPATSKHTQRVTMAFVSQSDMARQTTTAYALVDVLPGAGRISVSSLHLQSPVIIEYGANSIRVDTLRLVRPVTIALDRAGIGHLPADQLIWTATLVTIFPNGSQARERLDGPIRGELEVRLTNSTLQLTLDVRDFGTVNGTGRLAR
jgi:hypothetical protein